ncbi:MAG: transcriptional repressor [Verrucomicrobiota bacterium]
MDRKKSRKELLAWAVQQCRDHGLRRTKAMEEVLRALIERDQPLTLADLVDALGDLCDKATVYRLLIRLEDHGIIRRLGLHERSAYFTMRYPDRHDDYLICKECGKIDSIDIACPVEKIEKEISANSGFTNLYHELEFFGVCPKCA